jgi:DNA-binding transcriptional LysR family regulator
MLDLDDLKMFRALGSTGSLAAAARLMDLTPPALTIRLRKLEDKLGVHLAVRGARGVSLTEEGQRLLEEAVELLKQLDTLPERIAGEAHAMTGHLRVVAPFGFGRQHVASIVRDLHLAHPGLTVALTLSEHPLREAASNDVVVNIGAAKDSSWIGHLLAPNDRWLCASPAYVRRLGEPLAHPSQLERHACLCLKENDDDLTRWRFTGDSTGEAAKARKVVTVRVAGALSSNDGTVISQWAEDGLGIMVRSEWEAAPLVASGRLVRLLPQWQLDPAPVMALVPTRKGASARLRFFIEAARTALQPVPWRQKSRRR